MPVLRVLKNQARDFSFWNLALRSYASNLKLGGRWRDIRIESRTRCRNQIDRDGNTGILGLQLGDISANASNQLRIGRTEILAARGAGIVACSTRGGWPRMKIARPRKWLPDHPRPNYTSIGPLDQLAVGLLGEISCASPVTSRG